MTLAHSLLRVRSCFNGTFLLCGIYLTLIGAELLALLFMLFILRNRCIIFVRNHVNTGWF